MTSTKPKHHLAQINIARLLAPEGDPHVQGFFDQLDAVNALADESPGFVWRLIGDAGSATDIQATADPLLVVNMSVWQDVFKAFVYKSAHAPVMAKRRHWFEKFEGAHQALWWIPEGHIPSVHEGFAKLWHLEHLGPTEHAFTFREMPGRD